MRRWEARLARLLRALLACTVLLFAAQGSAVALEPVRDLSAWVAHTPLPPASTVRRARAARAQPRGPVEVAPRAARAQRVLSPGAVRAAADQRYLYLDLQTLRC